MAATTFIFRFVQNIFPSYDLKYAEDKYLVFFSGAKNLIHMNITIVIKLIHHHTTLKTSFGEMYKMYTQIKQ